MQDDDDGRKSAPAGAERAAIVQAAIDYIEGWFDGDAVRIGRALHADLAKRSLQEDGSVRTLTREMMIAFTAEGGGQTEDASDRQLEVEVDHLDGSLATAAVRCHMYIDYLQLVRTQEGWKIVNVLWRRRRPPA